MSKAEQKERTHESILASASRLLRERGIAGARVADVMDGAGLTVGGFYAHFASKEAMIDDALRRTGRELRDRLFSRIEDKPAEVRAEVVLKRYLSPAHRENFETGCAFPAVVGEIGTTAHAHAEVLGEQVEKMASALQEHLPDSRPAGQVAPRHLALGLLALMYGGLSLSRALRGTKLSDEMLKACRALGTFAARADRAEETGTRME